MKVPIEKLQFGVGRPEEWSAWGDFLNTFEGTMNDLSKREILWSLKLLYEDIKLNGTENPTIIDDRNYVLVGNQRLLVQQVLGYKEVECIKVYENPNWIKRYKTTDYDRVRGMHNQVGSQHEESTKEKA